MNKADQSPITYIKLHTSTHIVGNVMLKRSRLTVRKESTFCEVIQIVLPSSQRLVAKVVNNMGQGKKEIIICFKNSYKLFQKMVRVENY